MYHFPLKLLRQLKQSAGLTQLPLPLSSSGIPLFYNIYWTPDYEEAHVITLQKRAAKQQCTDARTHLDVADTQQLGRSSGDAYSQDNARLSLPETEAVMCSTN